MRQYELWWANLPRPTGHRPVLLLSRTSAYEHLTGVLVVEITSTIRSIPVEVTLGRSEGLRHSSVASLDNIRAIPKRLLERRIGTLHPLRILEVKRALGYALDWPELKQDVGGA